MGGRYNGGAPARGRGDDGVPRATHTAPQPATRASSCPYVFRHSSLAELCDHYLFVRISRELHAQRGLYIRCIWSQKINTRHCTYYPRQYGNDFGWNKLVLRHAHYRRATPEGKKLSRRYISAEKFFLLLFKRGGHLLLARHHQRRGCRQSVRRTRIRAGDQQPLYVRALLSPLELDREL